jgi:hypothetical protein
MSSNSPYDLTFFEKNNSPHNELEKAERAKLADDYEKAEKIFQFQFVFLDNFNLFFKEIFVFRDFWNHHNTCLTSEEITNVSKLIEFCESVNISLKRPIDLNIKSVISQKDLKKYDTLTYKSWIFINSFLNSMDYTPITVPLIKVLVDSKFLENLTEVFFNLKQKLIFAYLINEEAFDDHVTLKDFSEKHCWTEESTKQLLENIKKEIDIFDRENQIYANEAFRKDLEAYLGVIGRGKRGKYFSKKPFIYKSKEISFEQIRSIIERTYTKFDGNYEDSIDLSSKRIKLYAYMNNYEKNMREYALELYPNKIQNNYAIESLVKASSKCNISKLLVEEYFCNLYGN